MEQTAEKLTDNELIILNKLLIKFYYGLKQGLYGTKLLSLAHDVIRIKGFIPDLLQDLPF